jgi:hypothetical protein
MWVHCANEPLKSRSGSAETIEFVSATVLLITIHYEVLIARPSLARNMFYAISADTDLGADLACLATVHCLVILVLLRLS